MVYSGFVESLSWPIYPKQCLYLQCEDTLQNSEMGGDEYD